MFLTGIFGFLALSHTRTEFYEANNLRPESCWVSGPIQGHLIPTAVPLGKPRMDQGLVTAPPTLLHPQTTAAPSIRPIVTAATNVALVGMTAEPEGPQRNAPELSKQVSFQGRQVDCTSHILGLGCFRGVRITLFAELTS